MGEEGLLEKKPNAITTDVKVTELSQIVVRREEMATAEEESYVLEFT